MALKTENNNKEQSKSVSDNLAKKIVIRRLPPSMTKEQFLEIISPMPEYDYFYYCHADMRLGINAFCRAYIYFKEYDDIFSFRDRFDNYVFLDSKGNECAAIVEFAPYQRRFKFSESQKKDSKCNTIGEDSDYLKFLDQFDKPSGETLPSCETILEEIEQREQEKSEAGVGVMTPLLEYMKKKREDKKAALRERDREAKKRREEEKRSNNSHRDKRRDRDRDRDNHNKSDKSHQQNVKIMSKPRNSNNDNQVHPSSSSKKTDSASQKTGHGDNSHGSGGASTSSSSKTHSYRENRDRDRENRDNKDNTGNNNKSSSSGKNSGKLSGKSYRNHDSENRGNKNTDNKSTEKGEKKPDKSEKTDNKAGESASASTSKPKEQRDRDRDGKAKRPSLQIYNPAQRAAQREQKKDPQSSAQS